MLNALHEKFRYVKIGVALILMFTGVKLGILFFHIEIPIVISLATIFALLVGSIIISLIVTRKEKKEDEVKLKKVDL